MEKEIVWTDIARKDFFEIVSYLKENWPKEVLEHFAHTLDLKVQLVQKYPHIGFKSATHSRFRKTLVTKHYMLIYSIKKEHIVIHRVKHTSLK
jgi:toxin ParE1/3/4